VAELMWERPVPLSLSEKELLNAATLALLDQADVIRYRSGREKFRRGST
jgi:hypothetical protein